MFSAPAKAGNSRSRSDAFSARSVPRRTASVATASSSMLCGLAMRHASKLPVQQQRELPISPMRYRVALDTSWGRTRTRGRGPRPFPPTSHFPISVHESGAGAVRFERSNSTRRGYDGHQFVDTSSNRSGVNAAARSAWTCCKRSRMRALLGLGINDPTQHGRAGPRSQGQCGRLITRLFRRSANC